MSESPSVLTFGPAGEATRRHRLASLVRESPIPDAEFAMNLGLYLTPHALSRILFLDHLYRQILSVQGVVMEFGCRWGQGVSVFTALRGIYEPFNRLRTVVGFDTFAGLPPTSTEDGIQMAAGMYGVTAGYEGHLQNVLTLQEQESPLSHLTKFEVMKGDATETLSAYLERHPETIVALAYFDMDLYEPTRQCLMILRDRLTVGSVLGFDELNDASTPGETLALKEVFGLGRFAVRRYPHNARTSYVVVDR